MRFDDIRRHLKPYVIYNKRKTTVNHAFAAAVAPSDDFDEEKVRRAIQSLGQNPDEELKCVYCDAAAETWDHVFATVLNSKFSGAGHRIGNLVPCCKRCNSQKGNKKWDTYIRSLDEVDASRDARIHRIGQYLNEFYKDDDLLGELPEYDQLLKIRDRILRLMKKADLVAADIRRKMKSAKHAP